LAAAIQIVQPRLSIRANASCDSSGDHAGARSPVSPRVIWIAAASGVVFVKTCGRPSLPRAT
jgi:hypothetical protein